MLHAVIFDMDGVILDSEPLWQCAEIKVFARYGLQLTHRDCLKTMGLRVQQLVEFWQRRHPQLHLPVEEISDAILHEVVQQVEQQGELIDGVTQSIALFQKHGLPMGLATSSPSIMIDAVLKCTGLQNTFAVLQSAEHLPHGKPHPQVYLDCAEKLGFAPQHCLAIEDSVTGCIAAKAANMPLIAVPDVSLADDPRFAIANLKLNSLHELTDHLLEQVQL